MKKNISLFLCLILAAHLVGCSQAETPEDRLNAVLREERDCITADGKAQNLTSLIQGSKATSYAFLDMDGDGTDELLVNLTAKSDTVQGTVVLHDEATEVRAWLFWEREMQDIRADGSFCGADGAAVSVYSKIHFSENELSETELAYCHEIENVYRLNGSPASREEFDSFVMERESLASPEWIPVDTENLTVLEEEENYRVEMTADGKFVHFYILDNTGKVLEDSWNSASRYLGLEKDGDLLAIRYGLGTVGATLERYYDLAEGQVSRWYDVTARDGRCVYLFTSMDGKTVLQIANIFDSDELTKNVPGDYPDFVLTLLPESFTVSPEGEISFVYQNGQEVQTVTAKP